MAYFLIGDSITLTLLVLVILIFAYYLYNLYTNNIFRRLGIPGPAPFPLLGDLFNVARKGLYVNDVELVQKYGGVIGTFQGSTPIVLLSDPDLLRKVLIRDSNIFVNRRRLANVSGAMEHGLTMLQDDAWKNVRAIVSPTFSTAKLKAMYGLMDEISDVYNKRLLEYADKQEMFDFKVLNGQYTLDNIASCLFGLETNSLQNENVTLINHLKTFFTIRLTNIFLLIVLLSPRLASYLGKKGYSFLSMNAINYLTVMIDQVLDRRRRHLEKRNDFIQIIVDHEEEIKDEEQIAQPAKQSDESQQWGTLKKTLNDKEILAQALVFMIAGYETTSVLLSFFFYAMAIHPEIQEKVYDEIRQELGDDDITHEKINQLPYLDMVISETLRMYPPFIRFDRVASTSYELGDYVIPEGTIINVPVYPIHHNPALWPDPEQFIPERFLPTEKAKRHPMSYLPFGDGPRNCIGMRFALLEAKIGIAKALRVVEIQSCEKTEIPLQLGKLGILSANNGIWVRVVRRSS